MFTGLVQTTGSVVSTDSTGGALRIVLSAPALAGLWKEGDSIAVNGVCLTAMPFPSLELSGGAERVFKGAQRESTSAERESPSGVDFAADLAAETVARTTLGTLRVGSLVNLELPTPAGAPLGGHVVQGHVDGTGRMVSLVALGPDLATADWRMTIALPGTLAGGVIPQGSITVDGISLTVAEVHPPDARGGTSIEIAVIPHTYRSTHLRALKPGTPVNIETDVLGKYAHRAGSLKAHAAVHAEWLTGAYLLAHGY